MAGIRSLRRTLYHLRRKQEAENNLDLDYGNDMLCVACCLPIFSTPTTTTMLHDQCANHLLPAKLEAHPLHPGGDLILHQQSTTSSSSSSSPSSCSICGSICGTSFYKCPPPLDDGDDDDDDAEEEEDDDDDEVNDYDDDDDEGDDDDEDDEDDDEGDDDDDDDDTDYTCDFQLDLACALPIRILHRSHHHRLTAIKGKSYLSSFSCAACGTQHQQPPQSGRRILNARPGSARLLLMEFKKISVASAVDKWQVSYMCGPCDFWIHPDCALLPNAIIIDNKHHPHPLLLTYLDQDRKKGKCSICEHRYGRFDGLGIYACFHCGYSAHIKCVVYSDPGRIHFEPVKLRDAQVPDLFRLPMPNESISVMSHIFTKRSVVVTINGTSSSGDHEMVSNGKIHEHPLIVCGNDDDINNQHPTVARVCNACVQLISPSDPFYKCIFNNNELAAASRCCRDFFLHRCCAHLPTTLQTQHNNHMHPFTLISNPHVPLHTFIVPRDHPFNMFKMFNMFNMFVCAGCFKPCNGFAYACEDCDYYLDVVCAFMNTSITHDGHAHSHILRPLPFGCFKSTKCVCCARPFDLYYGIAYKCNSCRYFKIHAKCTLFPDTITHKFDRHPLKLVTTQTLNTTRDHHRLVRGEQMFCEICENDIEDTRTWYYGCEECDNYFHTGCIPCVDELSKIKFGFTIRAACHACPLTCVRALSVDGYRCGCGTCDRIIIKESDKLAFECSDCYFRIRAKCAAEELGY